VQIVFPTSAHTRSDTHPPYQTGVTFFDQRPGIPASERWKLVGSWGWNSMSNSQTTNINIYTWFSPDGITFQESKGHNSGGWADTQNVVMYDPATSSYAARIFGSTGERRTTIHTQATCLALVRASSSTVPPTLDLPYTCQSLFSLAPNYRSTGAKDVQTTGTSSDGLGVATSLTSRSHGLVTNPQRGWC
jgi:hypothetical protein